MTDFFLFFILVQWINLLCKVNFGQSCEKNDDFLAKEKD